MSTLLYSPGITIHISTAHDGLIDVTDDIISGSLALKENAQHELTFQLENPRRKYDRVFTPNDRVSVKMKRIRWLQVFSGYLNTVPFASVWPQTVNLTASCTLKRLLYTYYDPGAVPTFDLISKFSTSGETKDSDGHMSDRLIAVLRDICHWPVGSKEHSKSSTGDQDSIHIAKLPDKWFEAVSALYDKITPQIQPMAAAPGSVNPSASGGTMTGMDGTIPGGQGTKLTAEQMVKVCYQAGWRGDDIITAGGISWRESGWTVGIGGGRAAGNGQVACGLFQMLPGVWKYDMAKLLVDPVYDATWAYQKVFLGNGGGDNPRDPNVWWKVSSWGGAADGSEMGQSTLNEGYAKMREAMKTFSPGAVSATGAVAPVSITGGGSTEAGAHSQVGGDKPATAFVFPVPGGKDSKNYGDARGNNGITKPHIHEGTDIGAPSGTPIVSASDGVVSVTEVNNAPSGPSNSQGNNIEIIAPNGDGFVYLHMLKDSFLVRKGDTVKAGQQIGKVGDTGAPKGSFHLHFEYHPGGMGNPGADPEPILTGAATPGAPTTPAGGAVGLDSTLVDDSAYFPKPDTVSASMMGPRALINDSLVFPLVEALVKASMRSFCSAPNGDFIAWFPDYFGFYQQIGRMTIEPIELLDFTINWDDRFMVTHQFVTGSISGYKSDIQPSEDYQAMATTMGIASIEFPEILEAIIGADSGDWSDPLSIMQRFGARPNTTEMRAIVNHQAEFFYAVYLFMQAWADQFTAMVPISFMPELWPGMLMKIPSQGIQVYVNQVSHRWDFSDGQGFTTDVSVQAPSSLDGRFFGLPKAGGPPKKPKIAPNPKPKAPIPKPSPPPSKVI